MASHWFGGYVSSLCSPQGFSGFSYPAVSQVIGNSLVRAFMPATGARPKAAKINLMDCSFLCSEVEIPQTNGTTGPPSVCDNRSRFPGRSIALQHVFYLAQSSFFVFFTQGLFSASHFTMRVSVKSFHEGILSRT